MAGAGGSSLMQKRRLGKEGPEVSAVSLGLMSVGGGITYYDASMKPAAEEMIQKFLEKGGNHVDTSDGYGDGSTGGGESEKFLGEMIKKHGRDKFFVATKCTLATSLSKEEKFRNWGCPCADPAYIKEACAQSLERLGVDCIDLFYLHRADPKTPIEDSMKAMKELVTEGKVKYVGVSEHTPELIRKAHAVHPLTAVQQEWSPMARDLEGDIVPVCRELGIGIVPYSPLARGLLTGAHPRTKADMPKDWRNGPADTAWGTCGRSATDEALAANLALADKFADLAKKKGCTPAQLCLAWVLAQGPDVVPIPATTKAARVAENMDSVAVSLSKEEVDEISATIPQDKVIGSRYSSPYMTYNGK